MRTLGVVALAVVVAGCGSLDLGARAAAFVWRSETSDLGEPEWILQVDPLDGSRAKLLVAGYVSGACGFVRPLDPTAHGRGAFWIATGASCDTTATVFAESDLALQRPRSARDEGHLILGATRDATATYWLRAGSKATVEVPYETSCEGPSADCTITRAASPDWRTLEPGRPIGPHPGG
jgi:hypothetical protein